MPPAFSTKPSLNQAPLSQIGSWLKTKRKSEGLLQKEVAAQLGVSQTTISRIESGELNKPISTLSAYFNLFGYQMQCHLIDSGGEEIGSF